MKLYLQNHFVCESLSPAELDDFLALCTEEYYEKNKTIFCEQQPSKRFYILLKGKVKLNFGSDKDIEVFSSQVFGDWAMLNETVRLATAKTLLDAKVIAVDYQKLLNPNVFHPQIALKVVLALTKPILSRLQTISQTVSEILISQGESQQVEFKQSLRTNFNTGQKDDKMEFASVKTIAGFLNSKGGVLFIGVKDDASITGIDIDNFENEDKLLLHIGHLINAKLGKNAAGYAKESLITIEGKSVMRVDCSPSPEPVYLEDHGRQYFFVRQGPQTLSFNLKETVNYINGHF